MVSVWTIIAATILAQTSDTSEPWPLAAAAATGSAEPQWPEAASDFGPDALFERSLPSLAVPAGTPWAATFGVLGAGGSQGLGLTDVGMTRALLWNCWDGLPELNLTPGFGMHFLTGPSAVDLPPVLYDAYLQMSWRVLQRDNHGVSIGVTPGMYGDWRRVSGNTFQVTGWITGDWQLSSQVQLVGGIAVVRQLRSHWLPVGGVIWTPNEDWQFDLTIPRPRIARRIHQTEHWDTWAYLAGQFGGGAWAVDDGTGHNALFNYSDLRLVGGLNVWSGSGRELSVEAGYVWSRSVGIDGYVVDSPNDTWVLQGVWVF